MPKVIINLRRLDYMLIAIIVILYILTAVLENVIGQTFMRFLSPVLILVFVIVYLQTLRSLEQEFKRVKQASKKEILQNIDGVENKIDDSLSFENREIKTLRNIILKLEDNIKKEINTSVSNSYFQIDALIAINKVLENVQYPMPQFRGWAVSPDFTRLLMAQILGNRPGLIFELGTGVSTIISGYCLKMNGKGKIISLEHDEYYFSESLKNIEAHGLKDFIELYHAPLKQYEINSKAHSWYDLDALQINQPVDLMMVDGPPASIQKDSRYPAFPLLAKYLNQNAIILIDDYSREDEKRMVDEWLKDPLLEKLNIINTEKGTCVLRYSRSVSSK